MKTTLAKKEEVQLQRKWYVVDATNRPLGRVAARVASVLRGKHKPIFTPHVDTGDHVIVINAAKVLLTGRNKADQKFYRTHSGYRGNLKEVPYRRLLETNPNRLVEEAIRGMLPKNSLGRDMFRKLKVVSGAEHCHGAQQPEPLSIDKE